MNEMILTKNDLIDITNKLTSIPDIKSNIKEAISIAAPKLGIGKTVLRIQMYNTNDEYILFEDSFASESSVTEYFNSEGFINVQITVHKLIDTENWSDEQLADIHYLIGMVFIFFERNVLSEKIKESLFYNKLTGVPNNDYLMMFLSKLINENEFNKYAGFFLNIKNFKIVNKFFSSRVGDKLLREFSQKSNALMQKDELFVHFGGDNFFVMVKKENIQKFVEYFGSVMIDTELDGKEIHHLISCRMGICEVEDEFTRPAIIIGYANNCMALAKRPNNPDVIFYSKELYNILMHENEIAELLVPGIEKKEFVVYYQPKVNINTNEIVGAEALVRWIHGGRIMLPGEFIPIFESRGNVCQLDMYVLNQVCADIKRWLSDGIEPPKISVNFSKLHLYNPDFVNIVSDIVKTYGVATKYIEVELTETTNFEDFHILTEAVSKFKEMGISTSIDDFGTGYSSLTLLKQLSVDVLKLDRSFLSNDEMTERDKIVIENIVAMARGLNIDVIMEGVETIGQAEYLKNIDCVVAQGFLFDKPLTHDDFEKKISE